MKKKVAMKAMAAALAVTTVLGVVPAKSAYAYGVDQYRDGFYADIRGGREITSTDAYKRVSSYIYEDMPDLGWGTREQVAFCKSDKAFAMPKKQTHTYVWGKNYGVDPNNVTYVRYIDDDCEEVYRYGKNNGKDDEYHFKLDDFSLLQKRQADLVALDDRVEELNKKAKAWNKPIIAYNKKASAWNKKALALNKKNKYEYGLWPYEPWKLSSAEWVLGHPNLKLFKKEQPYLFKFCKGYTDTKHKSYYPRGYYDAEYCPLTYYYAHGYVVKNGKLYGAINDDEEVDVAGRTRIDDPQNVKGCTLMKRSKIFKLANTSDAAIHALGEQIEKLYKNIGDLWDRDKTSITYAIKMNKADTVKVFHKLQDYFYHKNQGIIPLELMMNPYHAKDEQGKNYNVLQWHSHKFLSEKALEIIFKSAKKNMREEAKDNPSIISQCKDFEKWQSFADIKEPINRIILYNYRDDKSIVLREEDGDRYVYDDSKITTYLGMSHTDHNSFVVTTYKGKQYIYDAYNAKFIPYTESKWKKIVKESPDPRGPYYYGSLVEE